MRIAHLPFDFSTGNKGGDRVDHDDIDGAAAFEQMIDNGAAEQTPPPRLCRLADNDLGDVPRPGVLEQGIGNVITREKHGQTGALLAHDILVDLGFDIEDVATIMGAIANHEESEGGLPVSAVSAAVIIADKSDVHRSRVRNPKTTTFDIHDRVNYAVEQSFLRVDSDARTVSLELTIDTTISQVMEYFEIFLGRMQLCRLAAEVLHCRFKLLINGAELA